MTMVQDLKRLSQSRQKQASWGHVSRERLRFVREYAKDRVLDVGCATGEYVRLLNREGYDCQGADALRYTEWGEDSCFRQATLPTLPYDDRAFDTVLCFETLEHVPQPKEALEEIRRVCSDNLILTVPNCEEAAAYRPSGFVPHHYVDPTHVNYFTRATLRTMLHEGGFRLDRIGLIHPLQPEVLLAYSYGLPLRLARAFGRLARHLPKRRFFMTIVAVASKDA
jgi:2-polyprenyl-3-methyl-5-hydroxy-6-metoxy-1,4-benzoquinol methylase